MKLNPPEQGINTVRHLAHLLEEKPDVLEDLASNFNRYYRPGKKVIKEKKRLIEKTLSDLKRLQKNIKNKLLELYSLPKTIFGGVKERGLLDNAKLHTNKPIVVTIDIKNCFPSTSHKQVFSIFREYYKCSTEVSSLLTRLTTYRGHVPQGVPTSTYLVHMALLSLHDELKIYCEKNGLALSFWVDDITFSGESADKHVGSVIKTVMKYGYSVRRKKIKVMRSNHPQIVAGILVNKKPNLPKEKRKAYAKTAQMSRSQTELKKTSDGQIAHAGYINKKLGDNLKSLRSA